MSSVCFQVHATYRADTVFTPIVATAVCKVDAQALRPDQVTNIQLLDKVERLGMAQFIVSLQWSPPVETNGQMSHYNVCVGTAPLNPSDPLPSLQCSPTGDCYACTPANVSHVQQNWVCHEDTVYHVQPTAVNMTWNVFQLFPPDTEFLYLQVLTVLYSLSPFLIVLIVRFVQTIFIVLDTGAILQ